MSAELEKLKEENTKLRMDFLTQGRQLRDAIAELKEERRLRRQEAFDSNNQEFEKNVITGLKEELDSVCNDNDELFERANDLEAELQELKAAVRWLNSYAYIEGDLDSHCQGVIDEAEESSSDADKAHAETLLKVLEEK